METVVGSGGSAVFKGSREIQRMIMRGRGLQADEKLVLVFPCLWGRHFVAVATSLAFRPPDPRATGIFQGMFSGCRPPARARPRNFKMFCGMPSSRPCATEADL